MEKLRKQYRLICDVMAKKPVRTDMVLWQGDSEAYRLEFVLRSGSEAFVPPEGTTAAVSFLRCDGTVASKSAEISDGVVVYEPDLQDVACPGQCMGTVELYNGNTRLTSWAFWFEVASAVGDGVITPGSDDVALVTQLVQELTAAGDYAKEQGDYAAQSIGDMTELTTGEKETMVGAINEVKGAFSELKLLPLKVEDGISIDLLSQEGLYYAEEEADGVKWNYYLVMTRMYSENEDRFLQLKLFDTPSSQCTDALGTANIMFRWGYQRTTVQESVPGGPPSTGPLVEFHWEPWETLVTSAAFETVADLQKWDKRVIKDEEFSGYTKLTSTDFPYTTEVGINAFANCTRLETVSLPKATTVKGYAFYNCKALKTADLPQVTDMGQDVFANCYVLETVNLPKVTAINKQSFYHCYKLEEVELPKVTRIGTNAFRSCTALNQLILGTDTVCTLADVDVFHESPIGKGLGKIYVPDELVDSYKAAENWSEFAESIYPQSQLT